MPAADLKAAAPESIQGPTEVIKTNADGVQDEFIFPITVDVPEGLVSWEARVLGAGGRDVRAIAALAPVPETVAFVRDFFEQGKPVGAICHGPWTLVEADVLNGRTLTSFPTHSTAGDRCLSKVFILCHLSFKSFCYIFPNI